MNDWGSYNEMVVQLQCDVHTNKVSAWCSASTSSSAAAKHQCYTLELYCQTTIINVIINCQKREGGFEFNYFWCSARSEWFHIEIIPLTMMFTNIWSEFALYLFRDCELGVHYLGCSTFIFVWFLQDNLLFSAIIIMTLNRFFSFGLLLYVVSGLNVEHSLDNGKVICDSFCSFSGQSFTLLRTLTINPASGVLSLSNTDSSFSDSDANSFLVFVD